MRGCFQSKNNQKYFSFEKIILSRGVNLPNQRLVQSLSDMSAQLLHCVVTPLQIWSKHL